MAPLITEAGRWLIFNERMTLAVKLMDDSMQRYQLTHDETNKTFKLSPDTDAGEPETEYTLSYTQPDYSHLVLQGKIKDVSLKVAVRKVDSVNFLLLNRGFHWVNERSFNR